MWREMSWVFALGCKYSQTQTLGSQRMTTGEWNWLYTESETPLDYFPYSVLAKWNSKSNQREMVKTKWDSN